MLNFIPNNVIAQRIYILDFSFIGRIVTNLRTRERKKNLHFGLNGASHNCGCHIRGYWWNKFHGSRNNKHLQAKEGSGGQSLKSMSMMTSRATIMIKSRPPLQILN